MTGDVAPRVDGFIITGGDASGLGVRSSMDSPQPPQAKDLDGNPRPVDGASDGTAVVDMGTYEFQPEASTAAHWIHFPFMYKAHVIGSR
jgi:hypothetical protein